MVIFDSPRILQDLGHLRPTRSTFQTQPSFYESFPTSSRRARSGYSSDRMKAPSLQTRPGGGGVRTSMLNTWLSVGDPRWGLCGIQSSSQAPRS